MAHTNTHLAEYIRIRVILQKHCGCTCVVVACCNVQRGESDFSFCAIINEQSYDILMSLLKGHGQRSESILRHTRQSVRSLAESWRKNMGEGKPVTTKQDGNKASLVRRGRDSGVLARFAVGSFSQFFSTSVGML